MDRIEASTDWWGVGVFGGVECRWSPIERVSLFGRGAAGILGAEYRSKGALFDDDRNPADFDEETQTFHGAFFRLGVGF
ncbi:MAG: hypothetical protein JRH10_17675 [Deltaproteobacteria bacterium]|nr:hypothetical protein [Deltaproteobacteria bacterium]MBW2445781.1 hypothetical protein [Deltaproteobacteria bacterium]